MGSHTRTAELDTGTDKAVKGRFSIPSFNNF